MPQVLAELKELVEYRRKYLGEVAGAGSILALGLSSRKNLCVHPRVAGVGGGGTGRRGRGVVEGEEDGERGQGVSEHRMR